MTMATSLHGAFGEPEFAFRLTASGFSGLLGREERLLLEEVL